jgi:RHS repeat-associated protein
LIYSTYLGASATTSAAAVAVDPAGDACVVGQTGYFSGMPAPFPTTAGAFQTTGLASQLAFVAKLNPSASALVYGSYLSGSSTDSASAVALDASGDAFVTGTTGGMGMPYPFPTTAGAYQTNAHGAMQIAFVTEMNPAGSAPVYSTFLGSDGQTQGTGVALDGAGSAYVTGWTASAMMYPFPTTTGAYQTTPGGGGPDAFLSKLSATGSALVYSSLLGGSGADEANAVAVDRLGQATVGGWTQSSNFPVVQPLPGQGSQHNHSQDGFLSTFNAAGSGLVFSSYLGGSSGDSVQGVAEDPLADLFVAGWTNSSDFPGGGAAGGGAFIVDVAAGVAPPVITGISPDTGTSATDNLTSATQLTLLGTAPAGSTVTLSRPGLGVIGSASADPSTGAWSFNYTGTTLTDGTYAFTATATVAGVTSASSATFLATVDTTAPTVTLTAPATTTSLGPQVQVTASDLNGLPDGTAVALDVDLNGDGLFTGPGETGYASGTLHAGAATITLPLLPGTGTYQLRARVTDRAGNQGTSAVQTLQVGTVSSPWQLTARVLRVDPEAGQAQEQLGDVSVTHELDLDQSPGTEQSGNAALVYHSDSVSVRPIVQAALTTPNSGALPTSIGVQLTWDGVLQSANPINFSTTGLAPGDVLLASAQVASPVATTGRHSWSLRVVIPGQPDAVASGITYVVTQDASPFGAGWTFSPVDQLVSIAADSNGPAGMLRIFGTGGWRFYASSGSGTFTSPAEDNGTLAGTGPYTYTTPEGVVTTFDSSGRQTSIVSADGHETLSFAWTNGLLTGMTAIDGAASTFTYTNGLLSGISTVGPRSWVIAHTGTALTQITDPDTSDAGGGVRSFTYDSINHLLSDTFGLLANRWTYDSSSGLATGLRWGNSSSPSLSTLSPAALQGLAALVRAPSQPGAVAQASLTDALGRVTSWQLDGDGRAVWQQADDGGVTTDVRDGAGRVTSETDPLGRVTSYQRDAQGYVTQETLPDNSTIVSTYQPSYGPGSTTVFHQLLTVTDPRTYTTSYGYDTAGHQTSVTNALNQTTVSAYDSTTGLLTSVTDALNHSTTFAHDSDRRLTTVTDARQGQTVMTYDANGNEASTTDPLNNTTYTTYNVMGWLVSQKDAMQDTETFTFDTSGLELTSTDYAGTQTADSYDTTGRGLVVRTRDAAGSAVEADTLSSYDADGEVVASRDGIGAWTNFAFSLAGGGLQTTTTDALGGVARSLTDLDGEETQSFDPLGYLTSQVYNSRGWVTSVTDAAGQTSTTGYDADGDVTSQTDALNKSTTAAFDQLDRLSTSTDQLNHSTTTTYDAADNVSTVTSARGFVTAWTYDELNRPTQETLAQGRPNQEVIVTAYDKDGNTTSVNYGAGVTVSYAYDALNRLITTTDALNHQTLTGYDKVGDVTSSTDALNKQTTFTFDALHRQIQISDPLSDSSSVVLNADDEQTAAIDALGHVTVSAHDLLGRQTSIINPVGALTQESYDADGREIALTDADNNTTRWLYDADGQVLSETDPLGHTTSNNYDADERLVSTTDRDGRTKDYTWLDNGLLQTEKDYAAGGQLVDTKSYTYNEDGQVLTASDNSGGYVMTYDELDREATVTDELGLTLTRSYDAANRQVTVTDSLGGVISSTYDAGNRLTSRTLSGTGQTPLRIDFGYDNRNELTSLTRYADLAGTQRVGGTTLGYDDAGRVTAITDTGPSPSTPVDGFGYTYNAAGQVTQETWQLGATKNYSYDADGQLLSDGLKTYSYDLTGNRTNAGYQTGPGNQLQTDGTWNYTYDAEGNETSKTNIQTGEKWVYGYNIDNHLTLAEHHATTSGPVDLRVTYKYDVFGNRMEKDVDPDGDGPLPAAVLRFAYDGSDVWADLDGSNHLVDRYIHGDGVDELLARVDGAGMLAWIETDRLGSVRDILDGTGALRDTLGYDSWGAVTTETNASWSGRYGWTGRERETETGLQHNGERFYDPGTGRWLQQDPSGFNAGDSNLYRYVNNEPVTTTDPFGLSPPVLDARGFPVVPDLSGPPGRPVPANPALGKAAVAPAPQQEMRWNRVLDVRPVGDGFVSNKLSGLSGSVSLHDAPLRARRFMEIRWQDWQLAPTYGWLEYQREADETFKTVFGMMGGFSRAAAAFDHIIRLVDDIAAPNPLGGGVAGGGPAGGPDNRIPIILQPPRPWLGMAAPRFGAASGNPGQLFTRGASFQTVQMPQGRGAWQRALEALGFRQGRAGSVVYIVRDRRTGEILKVVETGDVFSRFGPYMTKANRELRQIDIDIIRVLNSSGRDATRPARIALETDLRRGLSGQGHRLRWDETTYGWAPGTGPTQPPTQWRIQD